jgi:capsular polysaccharide biosynthesis protein
MSRFRLWSRSGHGTSSRRRSRGRADAAGALPAPGLDPRVDAYRRLASEVDPVRKVAVIATTGAPGDAFPVPTAVFGDASVTVFLLSDGEPSADQDAEDRAEGSNQGEDNDRATGHEPAHDPAWEVVTVEKPRQLHVGLAAAGPFDVLIDHGPRARLHKLHHLAQLLGHVRAGGVYVVDDLEAIRDETLTDSTGESALQFAMRLSQLAATPHLLPQASKQDLALAETIESVEVGRDLATLRMRLGARMKVRHGELAQIVRGRTDEPWSRGVRQVPRCEVVSKAMGYQNNDALRVARYPEVMEVPRLLVREYDDVIARPGQVLERDGLILPDSFRLWRAATLRSTRLASTSKNFVLPSKFTTPPERLAGQYYWVDSEYPRHFGHVMTEVLGRLWAWPEAKKDNPRLKLLVSSLLPYQAEIYAAYGIEREDIVTFEHPVQVESLVTPMPAFHISRYVSPDVIGETYERLQRGMPKAASPGGERVFLTRERGLWRECVNADELEDVFVRRGYDVLRPEMFSLPEQAALFREAKVVAGFIGSQLYGQLFSPDPLDVVGFVNTTYSSNNEYLLATALGHTLHQFWCPERPGTRTEDITGRRLLAMHHDYEFDFERDLPALSALLDRL